MPTLGIENNVLGILSRGLVQLGVFFYLGEIMAYFAAHTVVK